MPPLISVVMPTYNSERFLGEAIESILNQTFGDFEFVIVADKSSDRSDIILDYYAKRDNRIKIFMGENLGLISSLNKGCKLAKGKYIARMDSDDISLPRRLERQVQYLEKHPEIGVLGTGIRYVDEAGRLGKYVYNPMNPKLVKFYLHMENCFVHPSIMMRRDVVEGLGFYNTDAIDAEDYDLWSRATYVTQVSNLHEALLEYRVWSGGVSSHNSLSRNQTVIKIRQSMIDKLMNNNVLTDSIITPFDIASSSFLGMVPKIGKVASLVPHLYAAYLKSNELSWREKFEAAYLILIFLKNIIKEIVLVKLNLAEAK